MPVYHACLFPASVQIQLARRVSEVAMAMARLTAAAICAGQGGACQQEGKVHCCCSERMQSATSFQFQKPAVLLVLAMLCSKVILLDCAVTDMAATPSGPLGTHPGQGMVLDLHRKSCTQTTWSGTNPASLSGPQHFASQA